MKVLDLYKTTLREVPNIVASSKHVRILKIKPYINKANNNVVAVKVYKAADPQDVPNRRDINQVCTVTCLDKSGDIRKGNVKVSCSCEWFMYNCEVALHSKGAADIIYSNGEEPTETNPRKLPYVCAHLFYVLGEIKKVM